MKPFFRDNLRARQSRTADAELTLYAQGDEGGSLRAASGFVRRRGLLIVAVWFPLFLCLVVGAALMPPRYIAEAKVVIDPRPIKVLKPDPVLSQAPLENEPALTAMYLARSNDLVHRAISELGLLQDPELNPRRASRREAVVAFARAELPASLADLLARVILRGGSEDVRIAGRFHDRLQVSQEGRSNVIAIKFRAETPERAARIANGYAELFVKAQADERTQASEKAYAWLVDRVAEARRRSVLADTKAEEFRRANGLISGRTHTPAVQEVTDTSTELTAARTARDAAVARFRKAQALLGAGELEALGDMQRSPVVQQLRTQESTVMRRLAELEQIYGDKHPEVAKAQSDLARLRGKISSEAKLLMQALKNDAAVSESVVAALRRSADTARDRVAQENEAYVDLRVLEREAAAERKTADSLLTRLKEIAQEKLLHPSGDAKLASRADPPGAPFMPNMVLLTPAAAGLSFFIALVIALIPERSRRGIRSMQEVAPEFGVSALALVPHGHRAADQPITRPYAAFVEGLRHLYAGLPPAEPDEQDGGRSILITSSVAGEGKTTVAIGMGRLIARGQRRVVLVDADLRRSGIRRFTKDARLGLAEVLRGEAQLDDVLVTDTRSDLSILPAGRARIDSAFLLGSVRMEMVLEQLRSMFEVVVIDSPPVVPVADTLLMARMADQTIMVTQWERTPRETIRLALRQLMDSGAAVAGVAITRVSLKRHSTFGYADSVLYGPKNRRYYRA